jgi:hypothetical protein
MAWRPRLRLTLGMARSKRPEYRTAEWLLAPTPITWACGMTEPGPQVASVGDPLEASSTVRMTSEFRVDRVPELNQ